MAFACIGIGTNLGDRRAHLELATRELRHLPATDTVHLSPTYETEPVGPGEQGRFLNAAAAIETTLPPGELLGHLLRIERLAGREREVKWGPRTLDLDLLLYDDRIIETEDLTLPHPHMHERWFVLKPLNDIAPEAIHPTLGKTVRELLTEVEEEA